MKPEAIAKITSNLDQAKAFLKIGLLKGYEHDKERFAKHAKACFEEADDFLRETFKNGGAMDSDVFCAMFAAYGSIEALIAITELEAEKASES